MSIVYPATFRASHDGQVRLSHDLVVAEFVTVTVDKKKQTFTLRPATEDEEGSVPLKYYGQRQTPIMYFRRKLKELGLTPYEAKGTYLAKRVKDVVTVDQLLGHSRRDVLRFYTVRVSEYLRDAITRLEQLRATKTSPHSDSSLPAFPAQTGRGPTVVH